MEPKEILIKARKLIEDPENWIQGRFYHEGAYCGVGALVAAGASTSEQPLESHPAYTRLLKVLNYPSFTVFNDTHTHTEVLEIFDRAIASFD
jgi:hypothetical protein